MVDGCVGLAVNDERRNIVVSCGRMTTALLNMSRCKLLGRMGGPSRESPKASAFSSEPERAREATGRRRTGGMPTGVGACC